jgi:hypothetical protein
MLVAVCCAGLLGSSAFGQDVKAPPPVPDDAKALYAQLQIKGAGLAEVMAILQKEVDSVNADRVRLVQKLIAAQPEYDLTQAGALAVAYTAKKEKK